MIRDEAARDDRASPLFNPSHSSPLQPQTSNKESQAIDEQQKTSKKRKKKKKSNGNGNEFADAVKSTCFGNNGGSDLKSNDNEQGTKKISSVRESKEKREREQDSTESQGSESKRKRKRKRKSTSAGAGGEGGGGDSSSGHGLGDDTIPKNREPEVKKKKVYTDMNDIFSLLS